MALEHSQSSFVTMLKQYRLVGEHGADDPERVHAAVLQEPAVLGGDDRLEQLGRHLLVADVAPVGGVEEGAQERGPVGGVYRAFGA